MVTTPQARFIQTCSRCGQAVLIITNPDIQFGTAQIWTCPTCRHAHLVQVGGRIVSVSAEG